MVTKMLTRWQDQLKKQLSEMKVERGKWDTLLKTPKERVDFLEKENHHLQTIVAWYGAREFDIGLALGEKDYIRAIVLMEKVFSNEEGE